MNRPSNSRYQEVQECKDATRDRKRGDKLAERAEAIEAPDKTNEVYGLGF